MFSFQVQSRFVLLIFTISTLILLLLVYPSWRSGSILLLACYPNPKGPGNVMPSHNLLSPLSQPINSQQNVTSSLFRRVEGEESGWELRKKDIGRITRQKKQREIREKDREPQMKRKRLQQSNRNRLGQGITAKGESKRWQRGQERKKAHQSQRERREKKPVMYQASLGSSL